MVSTFRHLTLFADYINFGHRLPGSDPPQLLYEQHNIYNFDMSEALDNFGVMLLLHQKMMRDAEVVTAYQLMLANPDVEEPP